MTNTGHVWGGVLHGSHLPVWCRVVRGMTKKSVHGARAVTSDLSAAERNFKSQSYKSHRHGCVGAKFDNIRFVIMDLH
jgi:hypothetical protein